MYLKASVILLFITGSAVLYSFFPFPKNETHLPIPAQQSAAVVELFTSQGCSSCPSADLLLSEFIDQAEDRDLPIYGLSFHVDYWNRLGWKDPYSARAYTDRQYAYARKMRSTSVYTPQMIVNGTREFVGSNKRSASSAIRSALAGQQSVSIEVSDLSEVKSTLSFSYSTEGTGKNDIINIALVERDISTEVTRGENRGRQLNHDNVVRVFEQRPTGLSGKVSLEAPKDMDLSKSSIILYAQDLKSFEIKGATRVDLDQLSN